MNIHRNKQAPFQMRLGIFGDVAHHSLENGKITAFEPYVKEIRIWADLFSEVHVYSPLALDPPRTNVVEYERENVILHPLPLSTRRGKFGMICRLLGLPFLLASIIRGIRAVDFVHPRSPSQAGMFAALGARVMRRSSLTKWAGFNGRFVGQSITTRLDYLIQKRPSKLNQVLVYGPPQVSHQISFIPAGMSNLEITKARNISASKEWAPPWQILCVGRLSAEKNFCMVLEALSLMRERMSHIDWRFTLVGGGPEKERLEKRIRDLDLSNFVRMTGPLAFDEVQCLYADSHFLVLANPNEGWPKVVAEAWAHGAIPLAARGGIISDILREPDSGAIFESNPESLVEAFSALLENRERIQKMASEIYHYASDMSLEVFSERLEKVIIELHSANENTTSD